MTVQFSRQAQHEFQQARSYYESISPSLAERFERDVQDAVREIIRFPTAYPILLEALRGRRCRVFPYLVVYRVSDPIKVIGVFHVRRDRGALLKR